MEYDFLAIDGTSWDNCNYHETEGLLAAVIDCGYHMIAIKQEHYTIKINVNL